MEGSQAFPLPTGPSGTNIYEYYQAQETQYASNAYHNPMTGELLFFVVDGVVYDGEGYFLGSLDEFNLPTNNNKMRGVSEISIVPDPRDCLRFYAIGLSPNQSILNA